MQYEIKGAPFPVAVCRLENGETVNCQKGAMAWMTPNMQMNTGVGGGGGLLGALGKAASRALSGEAIFRNTYTAQGGEGEIAFASTVPGDIIAFELDGSNSIVAQKSAYLASESGVNMELFYQKKLSAGFFGGEGFIMQKFTGKGVVFLEIDGSVVKYTLASGQSMLIDTGYLAAMDATCSVSVESVSGIGNAMFGGEGLFNTKVTGPGNIWIQTMPTNVLADAVKAFIPTSSN
jgi:uncharacterized protein (TIGR00266 family)